MFSDVFQSGYISIFYALGSNPLQLWDKQTDARSGHVKIVVDEDLNSEVIEASADNISKNYITCPLDPNLKLGLKLPHLVLIVKNLDKYFSFEVLLHDDKKQQRRFRASNFQTTTRVKNYICTMPLKLDEGWNIVHLDLQDLCRRAYGTKYMETARIQIHANCRLRRVYFAETFENGHMPAEFKLFKGERN